MVFLRLFYAMAAFFLLERIARADARTLKIPARENCLLAACSLARVLVCPAGWAESAAVAVLFCGAMAAAVVAVMTAKAESGAKADPRFGESAMLSTAQPERFLMGGGDIKLVFAIFLQLDVRDIPLWGVTACLYILLTRTVWPEKRKLPLGPALGGACVCVLLWRLLSGAGCVW